jgi:hypothetical protein
MCQGHHNIKVSFMRMFHRNKGTSLKGEKVIHVWTTRDKQPYGGGGGVM